MEAQVDGLPSNCLWPFLVTSLLPVIYLSCMYAWDWSGVDRDDPDSIYRRFKGVVVACLLCLMITYDYTQPPTLAAFLSIIGIGSGPSTILAYGCTVIKLFLLTAALFLGPICEAVLFWDMDLLLMYRDTFFALIKQPIWLRNHLLAPITEELVFRGCAIPILMTCRMRLLADESDVTMTSGDVILITLTAPVWFSLAHFHHVIDKGREGFTVGEAIGQCTFQAGFTYLFGAFASYVFIRTRNLVGVIGVHAFCNHMGFPDVGMVWEFSGWRRGVLGGAYLVGLMLFVFFGERVLAGG